MWPGDLKAEAIKHVKSLHLHNYSILKNNRDAEYNLNLVNDNNGKVRWIKHFFDITDEDLK